VTPNPFLERGEHARGKNRPDGTTDGSPWTELSIGIKYAAGKSFRRMSGSGSLECSGARGTKTPTTRRRRFPARRPTRR
jgi:hypothetical protein